MGEGTKKDEAGRKKRRLNINLKKKKKKKKLRIKISLDQCGLELGMYECMMSCQKKIGRRK